MSEILEEPLFDITLFNDDEMLDIQLPGYMIDVRNESNEEAEKENRRFADLTENEMDKIVEEKHSKSTKRATNWCVSTFKAWCKEKNIQTPMERMTVGQLDANLRRFYAEARKIDGKEYSKKTLIGFRHGIERHLNQPPNNRSLQIASDPRFQRSNQMLDAKIVQLKRSGKETSEHKPPIESDDLVKMKTSEALAISNPVSLLRNVWFHVVLFFCRRGREGQRQLKTTSFKFEKDAAGRKYITMTHDEISKNHPGGLKDVSSTEKLARIYETEHVDSGFKAIQMYLSKLNPLCDSFFQYPRKSWSPNDEVWYDNRALGVNKLDKMMKEISQAAKLSRVYTNHSVRATTITLWSNAGVPNRHIMAISGHRNEQSLAHYNERPSSSQLQHCSDVLTENLHPSANNAIVSCRQPSLQLKTSFNNYQQNNLVVSDPKQSPTESLKSVFADCTFHNVQVVVHAKPSSS